MERLHATGPRQPCEVHGRIQADSLESSTRLPHLAFVSMVAQVHNPSRLTPHGTGSESGEAMHRSAYSYIRALLREGIHCITDKLWMADENDVQNARLILQKAADCHGRLQNMSQKMQTEEIDQIIEMEAEWTVLRIALVSAPNCPCKMLQLTRQLGVERQPARRRRALVCSSK